MFYSQAPFEGFSSLSCQDEVQEFWLPLEYVDQEEALSVTSGIASAHKKTPTNGLTKTWLMGELKKGLLDHLTNIVATRLPREERDEILGEVGLCITQWQVKGSFDNLLAEVGHGPSRKNMAEWVFRSMATRLLHRGKDVQLRDRTGARTYAEVKTGQLSMVATQLAPDTWKAITTEDESTAEKTTEIVDRRNTPEQAAELDSHELACLKTAEEILRVKRPRGAVRRIHVLTSALRGAKKMELENELGVSTLRAAFLRQEVRDDLREGLEMIEKARKILREVLDEPCSTKAEIAEVLGYSEKDVKEATRLLIQKRLITSSKDGALTPTLAAHNESF